MLSIQCGAQKYEWGRPAAQSEVAQLAKAGGAQIDEDKPYAEFWMGTHPNCPAVVSNTGEALSAWIRAHPASVGDAVLSHFGPDLPFLFKVLSVNKALSIQSHPDKALAEKLHAEHPKLYPDDNHKPEMALALGDDFEALCAFAPVPDIVTSLTAHPELSGLVGGQPALGALSAAEPGSDAQKQALRAVFTALMTAPPEAVAAAVTALTAKLRAAAQGGANLPDHDALALRLDKQYPGGDVGVLASYFLNYVRLQGGQALFLGANEPHAYLAGELVECMAASDNVIRAGLTPKFKHADVLCASLTYNNGLPEVYTGSSTTGEQGVRLYQPPTVEFEIRSVTTDASVVLPADPGPQILLVQHGAGTAAAAGGAVQGDGLAANALLTRGSVWFVPAGTSVEVTATPGAGRLQVWVAAVNATFFSLKAALPNVSNGHNASEPALVSA